MRKLRLGTRKSPLAMWQAYKAEERLKEYGYEVEIVPIASEGDLKLKQPIYELGITGVFTKTLDIALINKEIDIAVHSLKDVPTQLANGLQLTACLPRGDYRDILVVKNQDLFEKDKRVIATGSLRRKAFWLNQYPKDTVENLRGNVQLRLEKLLTNDWDAAIFAYAGLDRSEILSELKDKGLSYQFMENMVSAPSQGIVGIVSREDLDLSQISHQPSQQAGEIERAFLRKLEGGCTAPIGAYAEINGDEVKFHGAVLSLDGKEKIEIKTKEALGNPQEIGEKIANEVIEKGGDKLIVQIKKDMRK